MKTTIFFNYLQKGIGFRNINNLNLTKEKIIELTEEHKGKYFEIDLTNINKPFNKDILKDFDFEILNENQETITIQIILNREKFDKFYKLHYKTIKN